MSAPESRITSFLRGRPRNSSQSHANLTIDVHAQPPMLRRRRSGGTTPSNAPSPLPQQQHRPPPGTHRIRLVPHLDSRRALRFEAIARDLREADPALRIGRFTDRSGLGLAAVNALGSNKLAFKSKVVSRAHAEIWVDAAGKFFIRDTKSSSGTFLNHVRLSPANTESRPFPIKDGDILQLGVDYQGGTEDIYKSVKIRIEVGREWQAQANAFNTNAFKNLKALLPSKPSASGATTARPKSSSIPDCCICLFGVTIRQALFIAPCSHTFHYKCIRPILEAHQPSFSCPLCRTYADLEEDVEVENEEYAALGEETEEEGEIGRHAPQDAAGAEPSFLTAGPTNGGGADTEVENDVNGHHAPNPRGDMRGAHTTGEDDEEMVDVSVSVPGGFIHAEDTTPGAALGVLNANGAGYPFDGDVRMVVEDVGGGGGGGVAVVSATGGSASAGNDEDGMDGLVGGKRKR